MASSASRWSRYLTKAKPLGSPVLMSRGMYTSPSFPYLYGSRQFCCRRGVQGGGGGRGAERGRTTKATTQRVRVSNSTVCWPTFIRQTTTTTTTKRRRRRARTCIPPPRNLPKKIPLSADRSRTLTAQRQYQTKNLEGTGTKEFKIHPYRPAQTTCYNRTCPSNSPVT